MMTQQMVVVVVTVGRCKHAHEWTLMMSYAEALLPRVLLFKSSAYDTDKWPNVQIFLQLRDYYITGEEISHLTNMAYVPEMVDILRR